MENTNNVIVLKPYSGHGAKKARTTTPGVRINSKGWVYMNSALRVALQHYHKGPVRFRVEVSNDAMRFVADPTGYKIGKLDKAGWTMTVGGLKAVLPDGVFNKTMAAGVTAEGIVVVHYVDYVG